MITWQECKTDKTVDGTAAAELMCGMKCDKCGKEYGNEEHAFALFPDEASLNDEAFGSGKFVKDGDKHYCAECHAAIEAERKKQEDSNPPEERKKDAAIRLAMTVNGKTVFNMEVNAPLVEGLTVGDFVCAAKDMIDCMEKNNKDALMQKCRYDGDGIGDDVPRVCSHKKFTIDEKGHYEETKDDKPAEAVGQVEQTEA